VGSLRALFDTNILIDYLNGIPAAKEELARYDNVLISAITWMEVMIGANGDEEAVVRRFLARFEQMPITAQVAEQTVKLRQQHRMRLPNAIIWASAKCENALLVTRNSKDFPGTAGDVRIPYSLP
jgi:predicted nucleic acid-binding protein